MQTLVEKALRPLCNIGPIDGSFGRLALAFAN